MKRISHHINEKILMRIKRFFLAPSSNAQSIELIFLVLEMTIFTCLVNLNYFDCNIVLQGLTSTIIVIALIITMSLRYIFGMTVIRLIYLICIIYVLIIEDRVTHQVGISLMTLTCLVIEVLSTIQFEFQTKNPYSQTINITKILHYFVLISTTIGKQIHDSIFPKNYEWLIQLISIILFLILIIVKIQSITTNCGAKQIFLRFYLLNIAFFIRNMMRNLFQYSLGLTYQNLIIIVSSQLLYEVIKYRYGKFHLQISISNSDIVYVVSTILSYKFRNHYDSKFENEIKNFLSQKIAITKRGTKSIKLMHEEMVDDDLLQNNYYLSGTQKKVSYINTKKYDIISQIFNRTQSCNEIASHLEKLLRESIEEKTDNIFLCYFLIAQIKLWAFENVIESRKIVEKIKLKMNLSWVERICVYKFQQKIKEQLKRRYQLVFFNNFEQFFQNEQFSSLLIKDSYVYLSLWKYLSRNNYHFNKLKKMLTRVVQKNQQIDDMFQKIKIKCNTTIMMLIDYLYMVRRDVAQTWRISREFQIHEENNHFLDMENKVYLRINLVESVLTFENVGYNITKLLGYNRSTLKNSPISLLMPPVFINAHQKIISELLAVHNQQFFALKKNILVRHCEEFYCEAQIQLKMTTNKQNQLIMEGYLEILQNKKYNWLNYFIVRYESGEIIEIGPELRDLIDIGPRKQVNINQFFASQTEELEEKNPTNKYLFSNGEWYEYYLLKQLNTRTKTYAFYVCKVKEEINFEEYTTSQVYFKQQIKYPKYPIKYEDFQTNLDQYFIKKEQDIKIIKKKISVYFIIIVLLFVSTFVFQFILIDRIQVSQSQNNQIQTDLDNLLDFYHAIQNIGLYIDMQSITINLGVSYNYNYYNVSQLCLRAQNMNLKLSRFVFSDNKMYGSVGKTAINYPKPLFEIINNIIGNLFINLYENDLDLMIMGQNNFHNFFQSLFGEGFDDYLKSYSEMVGKMNDEDEKFKLVFESCICICTLIIYALMFKVDAQERGIQYQSINIICSINATSIMANTITDFLRRNSVSINEKDILDDEMEQEQKSNNPQAFNIVDNSVINKNQGMSIISSKENSVRELIDQHVLNSTERQDQNLNNIKQCLSQNVSNNNTLQQKEKIQFDEKERKSILTKQIDKKFILIWSIVIFLAIGINVGSIVSEKLSSQIVLSNSVENLLVILDNQILFSATVISYFDMLAFNSTSNSFMLNLNAYQKRDTKTYFVETNYQQFSHFTELYKNFTYVDICQFMNCDPLYKNQVDVLYYSNIYKFNNYMINNLNQVPILTKQFEIDVLLYGFYLLESTSYNIIQSYLHDYEAYENKKTEIYYIFYFCQFTVLCICFGATLFLFLHYFRSEKEKCFKILELVKKDSYNIVEEQI